MAVRNKKERNVETGSFSQVSIGLNKKSKNWVGLIKLDAVVLELQQSAIKAFNQIIRHKNIKKTSHAAQRPGTLINTSVKIKNNTHRFHLGGTRGTSFEK